MTRMPSAIAVVQAGNRRSEPSTSTTHTRHEPVSDRPRRWHIVGIVIPFSVATARIDSPSVPATSTPSIWSVRTLMPRSLPRPTGHTPAGQAWSTMCAAYSSRK